MDGQQQYADAMRAFDAYYGLRRTKFGLDWPAKKYAEHRSWKVFMKLAAQCCEAKRDIERYVATVLEHTRKNGDQIVPQDLVSKKAESIWVEHQADKKVDAADKWTMLVQLIIRIQASTGRTDTEILESGFNTQFPAWFRLLYPESMSDSLISGWGEEALEELRNDRDLVRFLRAAMAGKMEEFERRLGVINGL